MIELSIICIRELDLREISLSSTLQYDLLILNRIRFSLSSQQSVFSQHCRRIGEQLQRTRPTWERKVRRKEIQSLTSRASLISIR